MSIYAKIERCLIKKIVYTYAQQILQVRLVSYNYTLICFVRDEIENLSNNNFLWLLQLLNKVNYIGNY